MSNYRWIDGVITYTPKIRDVEDYIIDNLGQVLTSKQVMDACDATLHEFLIAWRNATRWDGYKATRTEHKIGKRGKKVTYMLEVVKLQEGET